MNIKSKFEWKMRTFKIVWNQGAAWIKGAFIFNWRLWKTSEAWYDDLGGFD